MCFNFVARVWQAWVPLARRRQIAGSILTGLHIPGSWMYLVVDVLATGCYRTHIAYPCFVVCVLIIHSAAAPESTAARPPKAIAGHSLEALQAVHLRTCNLSTPWLPDKYSGVQTASGCILKPTRCLDSRAFEFRRLLEQR